MRTRTRLVAKIGAGLTLSMLLLCASFLAYLEFADLTNRLSLLESLASRAIGRDLKIEGPLTLDLGRKIEIKAGRIRLANAPWSAETSMLDMRDIHLVIQTGSLFSGPLRFSRISVPQAAIIVHRDTGHGLNWALAPDSKDKPVAMPALAEPALPVVIDQLDARQISLLFRGPNLKADVPMIIGQLSINERESGNLELAASGVLSSKPWVLQGDLGSVASLASGRQIQSTLQMTFNTTRLALSASTADLAHLKDVAIQVKFDGPELLRITEPLGLPQIAHGEFHLDTQIQANAEQFQATLDARAGELFADIDLEARQLNSEEPLVDAEIRANGPNLGGIAALLGLPGLAENPFSISGKFRREAGITQFDNLVLQAPNTLVSLSGEITRPPGYVGTRLDVEFEIPSTRFLSDKFGLDWLTPGPAVLTATLEQSESGLNLSEAELTVASARVMSSGQVGNLETLDGTRLSIELESPSAKELGQLLSQPDWPALPMTASTELKISSGQWTLSELSTRLGAGTATASGSLGLGPETIQADLQLKISLPSMAPLGNSLGLPDLPDLPLQGSAGLKMARGNIQLDSVVLDMGTLSLAGTAGVDLNSPSGYQLESTLSARGENFRKAVRLAGLDQAPELPWEASSRVHADQNSLRLEGLDMQLGATRIRGHGEYFSGLSGSHVALQAEGPDARTLLPILQEHALQPLPFTLAADLTRDPHGIRLQDLRANIAGLSLESSGILGDWPELDGSNLGFSLNSADLSASMQNWTGTAGRGAAFELTGQLRKTGGDVLLKADSRVGEDSLGLEGRLGAGSPRKFTINARGTRLDLDRLAGLWSAAETPAKPRPDKTTRIIPDIEFPATWPDYLDGEATLDLDSLRYGEREFSDIYMEAKLNPQALEIPVLRTKAGDGISSAIFKARPLETGVHVETSISGTDVKIGIASSAAGITERPPTDMQIQLSGTGAGLRELAGNLDGKITLSHGKGSIANSVITSDFLAELLRLLNPLRQADTPTALQCGLVILDVKQGMVTTEIAMDQTNRLLITALANANLKDEQIEVLFTIMNREGIGISATSIVNPYVKITGTLARPTLRFAPTRAAISYGAAVASGGLSVLAKGVWDRLASSGQQCEKELAKRNMRLPGT